jgi:hypothetical protein
VGGLLAVQTMTLPGTEIEVPPDDLPLERRAHLGARGWPALAFVERALAGARAHGERGAVPRPVGGRPLGFPGAR